MSAISRFTASILLMSMLSTHHLPAGDRPREEAVGSESQPAVEFPYRDLLPATETGALRFLADHSEYDGRGITVAIFDTGVDPGAPGLSVTSDGRPKIVDLVDATGSGDVLMSVVRQASEKTIEGLSGRTLTIDPEWTNPSGDFRLGLKAGFELFPEELVNRLKRERRQSWDVRQDQRLAEIRKSILIWDAEHSQPSREDLRRREELVAQQSVLESAREDYDDPGPIYDCVTFHDGDAWWAIVDTDEDGDLTDEQRLRSFHQQHQFASFGEMSQLNFSVNIYDEGQRLSIVTLSGDHGTHVAGIVGACFPDDPDRNGIAPGVQIVSVKIGDTRLGSMETGRALVRGLRTVLDRKCDLINMSYGEPSSTPDNGRLIDLFSEVVNEHGVIFVASAGNSGPALSTVGAPGGSTDAILGIGAYVSPAMMAAEYSLRRPLEGMPYSWTSRGPALDGASGVDLFAPGGAVSPVPNYNLQPSLRMNGTSMASPNACGNIALLLSATKAEQMTTTPALVRRALQNTASQLTGVDRFAQGAGLLQIDRAHQWLSEQPPTLAESLSYQVRVGSEQTRGILLRELEEMQRPLVTEVSVRPRFRKNATKRNLVEFEVPLLLSTDQPWVEVGQSLLLTAGGAEFELQVDPTGLPPGIHSATVQAKQATDVGRGPLFEVPITIVKPPEPRDEFVTKVTLEAGQVVRGLATVPEGATWADIRLKLTGADGVRRLMLHAVQLIPGQSFEDGERKQAVNVEPGSDFVASLPVVAGRTLEVALTQYWSSLGSTEIEWNIRFRGLMPSAHELTLPADGAPTAVHVSSSLRRERCRPDGAFSIHRQILRPTKVVREPLISDRDRLPDGRPTNRLLLTYPIEQQKRAETTIRVPTFDGLLYDGPLEGFEWMLTDEGGRLIRTDDGYPESFSLEKGSYTLQMELRHADIDVLDELAGVQLAVDHKLSSSIKVQAYRDRAGAVSDERKFPTTWLDPGESATIWLASPGEAPENAEAGDVLIGEITYVESPAGALGAQSRPGGFPLRWIVPPPAIESEMGLKPPSDPEPPLAQRLETERLNQVIKQIGDLQWPEDRQLFDELADSIRQQHPDANRRLLIAKLHLLDNDDRKERLPEVIEAADEVIESINPENLRVRLAARPQDDDWEGQEDLRAAEDLKEMLVDALYRKGRALAYQELPDVVELHPVDDADAHDRAFEANFQQLASWVETTDSKYVLLHIRRERRQGRHATALKLLNEEISSDSSPRRLLYKKRRDLYEELGWDDWRAYEQKWMLLRFPQGNHVF